MKTRNAFWIVDFYHCRLRRHQIRNVSRIQIGYLRVQSVSLDAHTVPHRILVCYMCFDDESSSLEVFYRRCAPARPPVESPLDGWKICRRKEIGNFEFNRLFFSLYCLLTLLRFNIFWPGSVVSHRMTFYSVSPSCRFFFFFCPLIKIEFFIK